MRQALATAAIAASFFAGVASAAQASCGPNNKCPSESPCCSLYGQCGAGAYCLGGCDPLFSFSLNSCIPSATCVSTDYKLDSLDDVASLDKYLGDNSKANWVSSGKPLVYNDALLLTMAQDTVGTLLSSTHYVWYGKVCSKMTTSRGKGVVTAFIMMSDARDEIDFEWVGIDTQNSQSNFYSQGVTVYTNMKTIASSNTDSTVHEYCIDWKPDTLTWSVDGNNLRTVKRSDTWNATSNRFDYPQTPSRVMLSLWPAGLPTNGEGTIEWAGGLIDWNSEYMQNGYYYAMVQDVTVQCYDPPSGANIAGSKSYKYTGLAGTNNTIQVTDDVVVLKSFYATGDNPNYDPNAKASESKTGSAAAAATSAVVETIPGMSGIGNQGSNDANPAASSAGTDDTSAATVASSNPASTGGFSQGNSGTGTSSGAADTKGKALGGSFFAVCVGMLALFIL